MGQVVPHLLNIMNASFFFEERVCYVATPDGLEISKCYRVVGVETKDSNFVSSINVISTFDASPIQAILNALKNYAK